MAKLSLGTVSNIGGNPNSAATTLNANAAAISSEFENTLSRDGSLPNHMEAPLDMNHNRIINVGSPENGTDAVRLVDIQNGVTGTTLTIPSLAGNAGKFLGTDGTTAFWATPNSEYVIVTGINPLGGDHSPIIQAALNTGKSVWLPPGNITVETPLQLKFSGQILAGSGMHSTTLVPWGDFTVGGVIQIAAGTEGCQVRDLGFRGDNMTGGKAFNIQEANRVLISNISSHFLWEVAYVRQCNLVVFDNHWHNYVKAVAGNQFMLDSGNPSWRSDVIVFNNVTSSTHPSLLPSQRPVGLLWSGNCHTVIVQGMRFIQPKVGLHVIASGGIFPNTTPAFGQFDDFEVDYPSENTIRIEGGQSYWFSNSYFCNGQSSHGVFIGAGAHVGGFTNCIIRGNRGHGVYINGTDFKFSNCHIALNSWGAGNFGINSGVFCDSESARVTFASCHSGSEFGSGSTQQWGIISAGGSENISWSGGYLGGNLMGSWLDNSGTGNNSLEVHGATGSTMGRINDLLIGTSNGWGANLDANVSSGVVTSIGIFTPGKHYSTPPSVIIFDPEGTGSGATATANVSQGRISSITVTNGGSGYSVKTMAYVIASQTLPSVRPYNQSTNNLGLQLLAKGTDRVRIGNDIGVGIEIGTVVDAADDAAAAGAGVVVGQMYRTGSALKIRVS